MIFSENLLAGLCVADFVWPMMCTLREFPFWLMY